MRCWELFTIFLAVIVAVDGTDSTDDEEEQFVREVVDKMVKESLNVESLSGLNRRLRGIEEGDNRDSLVSSDLEVIKAELVTVGTRLAAMEKPLTAMAQIFKIVSREHGPTATDCGGTLTYRQDFIKFQAPIILPYSYTCVWTLMARSYDHVTLVQDNFAQSNATLGALPMGLIWDNDTAQGPIEWVPGDRGQKLFPGTDGGFVELIVPANSSIPPHFVLALSSSSRGHYRPRKNQHFDTLNGTIESIGGDPETKTYQSSVILPSGPEGREIHLILTFMDIDTGRHCELSPLKVWNIRSRSITWTGNGGGYGFCGGQLNQSSLLIEADTVGWIVLYETSPDKLGFSMDDYTIPSND